MEVINELFRATLFTISLGSTTLNGTDPNRVTVTATNYFLYDEAGNEYDPDILWHDIALIKLDSPVTTNGKSLIFLSNKL